jgi:hypothetical protein
VNLELPRSQLTESQWKLLQSRERQVLVAGGFGSGKTTAIGLKLLQLKAENPGVPGLLMAQSWRALWSITLRRLMSTLRRVLPRNALPALRTEARSHCLFLRAAPGVSSARAVWPICWTGWPFDVVTRPLASTCAGRASIGISVAKSPCVRGVEAPATLQRSGDLTQSTRLHQEAQRHADATVALALETNSAHFNEGRDRLDRWAEDMVKAAEQALKNTKDQIKVAQR